MKPLSSYIGEVQTVYNVFLFETFEERDRLIAIAKKRGEFVMTRMFA